MIVKWNWIVFFFSLNHNCESRGENKEKPDQTYKEYIISWSEYGKIYLLCHPICPLPHQFSRIQMLQLLSYIEANRMGRG